MLPRVRTILDLPVVQAAGPTVLSGADELDRDVRWVHVSEQPDMADLLHGGEMVLSTGLAISDSADVTVGYLRALEAAGAVALMVDIDRDRTGAAAALRVAAAQVTMPVITLARRVRFVEITETVHRSIVAEQFDKVELARSVHEAFTALSLESANVADIVARAAGIIGSPVVLEDLAHRVVAHTALDASAPELLADWEGRSRSTHFLEHTGRAGPEAWLQTPVGTRTQRWGRLIVPGATNDDDSTAMVLERASQALSINRLAERDRWQLSHEAQSGLLHELRQAHGPAPSDAGARAEALGLKRSSRYLPLVIRVDESAGDDGDPLAIQRKDRAVLDAVAAALVSTHGSALAAGLQAGSIGVLLAAPEETGATKAATTGSAGSAPEDSLLERFCAAVTKQPQLAGVSVTIGVGAGRSSVTLAAAGLDEAGHVAETAATLHERGRSFFRSTDVRLRGLLALLRNDPRAQLFVESELAGILAPEVPAVPGGSGGSGNAADLELLRRYLESGGNKAALARTGYVSRPTLYARLARLEDRLGVDLEDPESRTSLHVAVLLHSLRSLR